MKWVKRILILFAVVIVMAIVVSACSYWMLRREPEWYVSRT